MNVTFKHFGAHMASSRYRSIIPAQQLQKAGITEGTDWLVIGKHGWNWQKETGGFRRVCFDLCDDHFNGPHAGHYRMACATADLLTCNSEEMARVVLAETGRQAVVIPDPYEQPERAPRINDQLLWFGHLSNIEDLKPWMAFLGEYMDSGRMEVVTNLDNNCAGVTPWSPEAMNAAFDRAGIVVIPTGKSMAKSANRAIESIRRGLFVVAGYLPAYADLGIYIGNIADGVKWALEHKEDALYRVSAAQSYIDREYSPERIGRLWLKALS